MGWGQVLAHGGMDVLRHSPDIVFGPAFGLPAQLYHTARQVAGYEPTTPGLNRIVTTGLRGMAGMGPTTTPTGKPFQAAGVSDALRVARQIKAPFDYAANTTPQQAQQDAKRQIYNRAPQTVSDALAAAQLVHGAAGALRGAPGIAGRAAGVVSEGAGAVANPPSAITRLRRGPPPVDAAGNLHPNVAAHLENVAPGSSAELGVNAPFRQRVIQTMTGKGMNDAAAREAIVQHHLPNATSLPRAAMTGVQAARPAAATASDTLTANALRNSGQQISSGPALDAPGMLATDPATGRLVMPTQQIRDFTQSPAGAGVFTLPDASNVRLATHAQDILQTPPMGNTAAPPVLGPTVRKAIGAGTTLGAGLIGGHFAHWAPSLLEMGGLGTAGALAEGSLVEPLLTNRAIRAASAGAPTPGGWADSAANLGRWVAPTTLASKVLPGTPGGPQAAPQAPVGPHQVAGPTLLAPAPGAAPAAAPPPDTTDYANMPLPDDEAPTTPAPHEGHAPKAAPKPDSDVTDYANMPLPDDAAKAGGGRVGFAVGGEVSDMTERLLKRAEGAQKAAQASTKPLLGLSDTTVAQALRAAQRGI